VGRDGDISEVICKRTKQEYFFKGGWTGFCLTGKSLCTLPSSRAPVARLSPRYCEERSDEAIQLSFHGAKAGLLRGACHRARVRATRWVAMMVGPENKNAARDWTAF
jgi:hypothetical protein